PDRPPWQRRPGLPAVPPSMGRRYGCETGRAPQGVHNARGSHPPGPPRSHRPPSRPRPSAPGYTSVRRNKTTPVSSTPRPPRPASRWADAHGWSIGGTAGRNGAPRLRPMPPPETYRPMGGGGVFQGRRPRPGGLVHGPSAHAGGLARSASSSRLRGWARDIQHTPMRYTSEALHARDT